MQTINGYHGIPEGDDTPDVPRDFANLAAQLLPKQDTSILSPQNGGTGRNDGTVANADRATTADTATDVPNVTTGGGASINIDLGGGSLDGNGYFHVGGAGDEAWRAKFGGSAVVGVNGVLQVDNGGTGRTNQGPATNSLFYQRTTLNASFTVVAGASHAASLGAIVGNSWANGNHRIIGVSSIHFGGTENPSALSLDYSYIENTGEFPNITAQNLNFKVTNHTTQNVSIETITCDFLMIPQTGSTIVGFEYYTHTE